MSSSSADRPLPVELMTLVRSGADVPSGSPDSYSDKCRWHDPSLRRAQYLTNEIAVAQARAARALAIAGATDKDVVRGPSLLSVQCSTGKTGSRSEAVDLTFPAALSAAGLPIDFPTGAYEPDVRHRCRATGEDNFTAGKIALRALAPEPQVRGSVEYVADLAEVSLTVVQVRDFRSWF